MTMNDDSKRIVTLAAQTAVFFAIVFGAITAALIVWNRSYQIDEVEHIHAAYNMRDGRVIYRDFWQGHPPLLYALLVPMIDVDDPVSSYHRARVATGLFLFTTIGLVAACGWRLAGRAGALGGSVLALFHTTLIERGMEVRPDGPLGLCTILALYLELRGGNAVRRYCAEAAVLGTAFLLTQKAIFPAVAFGGLWLYDAWQQRKVRLVIAPALAWFAPLAVALLIMLPFGCAREFVQQNIVDAFFAGAGAEYRGRFSPMPGIIHESLRNVVFVLLALGGIVWSALQRRRELMFLAALAVTTIIALWLNPFPWPYIHAAALPVLAVVSAVAVAALDERIGMKMTMVALAAGLAMSTSVPRLLQKTASTTGPQFATLNEVQRVTECCDTVFDLAGLYFRPDAYPSAYAMSGELLRWYGQGGFPRMVPELRRNACSAVILNYRTRALAGDERKFISTHYAHYWGNLFLAGLELTGVAEGTSVPFEVLKMRDFRYEGGGAISVDGKPFREGMLTEGTHVVRVDRAAPSRIIMSTRSPAPPPAPPAELYVNFD